MTYAGAHAGVAESAGAHCPCHWVAGQELGAPRGGAISAQACAACEAASAYGLQGVAGLKFGGLVQRDRFVQQSPA